MKRRERQVQPNAGWGDLCADCKFTSPPEVKYSSFPPDIPCSKIKKVRFRHWVVPDLTAWSDGTETCSDYEKG
jgi:hypothetical protein